MKIAVVDIETTGFLKQGGLIVEVAVIGLDLDTGEIEHNFSSVVRDDRLTEEHTKGKYGWVFQNSDLKYEDVDNARDIKTLIPEIQSALDDYSHGATAFNKSFDFGFLRDYGLKIKELPCIMKVATPVVAIPHKFGGMKWPKVTEAWKHLFPGIEYTEAHRALDDAEHEAKIVYELYKMGKFKPFLKDGLI